MARIHLFEFEDQKWFPSFLRNYATDFLQFLSNKTKIYKPIIPVIVKGLRDGNSKTIVDLASGGGGGLIWLNTELQNSVNGLQIVMTDFFPNIPAMTYTSRFAQNFRFLKEPVDARDVPQDLKGLRTQFLSLHHFRPDDVKKIFQNAMKAEQPIAIVEAQERSIPSLLAMLFSPITVLLTTPFIRPFRIGRIIFTYLIPIVPLVVLWDGLVSSLRTYSVKEMKDIVEEVNPVHKYDWEIDRIRSGPGIILYILGTKTTKS